MINLSNAIILGSRLINTAAMTFVHPHKAFPYFDYDKFGEKTEPDSFWANYTIIGDRLARVTNAKQSLAYLDWRSSVYPKFHELMGLWGNHDGETILDYGCGAANDIVGFAQYTKAEHIIGIDISSKVLRFAGWRLSLHDFPYDRIKLIKISDSDTKNERALPLLDNSVDFIYCEGVLHHTSNPFHILKEFHRVLKPHGRASIMVYNRESLWYHLWIPYVRMIRGGEFSGLTTDQAFAKSTDSENCPISLCFIPSAFVHLCVDARLKAQFIGGYFSIAETDAYKQMGIAMIDSRLDTEHRDFMNELRNDKDGLPMYHGKYAGIGGVYQLTK